MLALQAGSMESEDDCLCMATIIECSQMLCYPIFQIDYHINSV
jgi:hypothetical protein